MILNLTLDLPDDGAYTAFTCQIGRGLLETLKVVEQDIEDVETIVSELVSNVLRHAHSDERRYRVQLEFRADQIVITVIDVGHGFAFQDVPEIGSLRSDGAGGERVGGFGLPLLDALADKLVFSRTDPHGTTVRAEKRLHYQTPEAAAGAQAICGAGASVRLP